MLKYIVFCSMLLFLAGVVFSQHPGLHDSTQRGVKNFQGKDSAAIILLNSKAMDLIYNTPDSAILLAGDAFRLSRESGYPAGEARALNTIGSAHYVKGAFDVSLEYTLRSLKISEAAGQTRHRASALNNVGLVYLAQDRSDQAINEFENALNAAKQAEDVKLQATINFNIGLCYDQKKNLEEALLYFDRALLLARQTDNERIETMALNRLGETWFLLKDYNKALSYYQQVTGNATYRNDWENSFAYSGLAQVEFALGNYRNALDHAHKGLALARSVNAKWDIERCLKILYTIYATQNDFRNAFKYLELDKVYSDSLHDEAKEKEINSLLLKEKARENERLQTQNELKAVKISQNRSVIILIAGFALSLVVALCLILYYLGQKSKLHQELKRKSDDINLKNQMITAQNAQLEAANQTKDQLFSVIGHDLRSPFASILQAMEMRRDGDLSSEEMNQFLDSFSEKVAVTAAVLDNLVVWAQSQQQGIRADRQSVNIYTITEQVLGISYFLFQKKNITLTHSKPAYAMVLADPDHVRIIVHNLIANAIKFTPENGRIDILYTEQKDKLLFHVKDSGVGMAPDKIDKLFSSIGKEVTTYGTNMEKGIGIGLVLVKNFAAENNAGVEVSSTAGRGTEFCVSFLKAESAKA